MSTKERPAVNVTSLDHIVLTVKSVPDTIKWFGSQKINLHQLGKEFEPKALRVQDGSADLCFVTKDDVHDVRERLIKNNVEMVDLGEEKTDRGVVQRTGAIGTLRSVYCRDPDGNLIEISNYT